MRHLFIFLLLSFMIFSNNKVVIINSYSKDLLWTHEQEEFFKTALGSGYDYQSFYMDTKRIKESEFKGVANKLLTEIKNIKPKLVYITDDNALKYVGTYVDANIPIIYSGINDSIRNEYPWVLERKNVFGLSERPLIFRTINTITEKLNLKDSKVLILLGDDSTGRGIFDFDLGGRNTLNLKNSSQINVIKTSSFEEWKTYILDSKNKGFTFVMPLSNYALLDKNGLILNYSEVIGWTSKNSPIPVFTIHADQIGPNMAVGGVVLRGKYFGEEAGKMAKQLLSGNTQNLNSKTLETGDVTFSKNELEKWGFLTTSKDSSIIFSK